MPLSEPEAREPIHQRQISCRGFRRDDDLWDIEGHLVDTKTYTFPNRFRGEIKAGEPIHEMWLRLTLDDALCIRSVEAKTDAGPFAQCPDITDAFRRLEGLTIEPGFTQRVQELFRGPDGCTHHVELVRSVAATAVQTLFASRRDGKAARAQNGRPRFLDTCHALASDGPVVRDHWPKFYTGPEED